MILYDYAPSPNSRKVRLVLAEKGLPYERRHIDIARGQQRAEAFLAINPRGQVPALVDTRTNPDGTRRTVTVYDSTIINEYLEEAYPDPPLFPTDPADRAMARILEDWADNVLVEPTGVLYAQYVFTSERRRNQAKIEEARMRIIELLKRLEDILSDGRPYLLGEYSIADAAVTPSITYAAQFGAPIAHLLPRTNQWFTRLKNRPSFES